MKHASRAAGQDAAQSPAPENRDLLARLLKRLAHEIRNPLSSLDVQFQLLEEDLGALAPEVRPPLGPRLGVIRGELQRLDSIVERFLKLAGPSALELAPVQLNDIVTHVCELLRPEASRRNVEILTAVEPDLPLGDGGFGPADAGAAECHHQWHASDQRRRPGERQRGQGRR